MWNISLILRYALQRTEVRGMCSVCADLKKKDMVIMNLFWQTSGDVDVSLILYFFHKDSYRNTIG